MSSLCLTAWLPHVWMQQSCIAYVCVQCWHTALWYVKMFACGDSFCLSDGCEGQSLLEVSQNGLSLSLASLFSGICRLDWRVWLHSYLQAVYCGCAPLRGSCWFCSKLTNILPLIAFLMLDVGHAKLPSSIVHSSQYRFLLWIVHEVLQVLLLLCKLRRKILT